MNSLDTFLPQYEQEPDFSTQILRQCIPLMVKHQMAPHPINYAIWYDYVSNNNPALNQAIDELLDNNTPFDEKVSIDLYARYICNASLEKFSQINSNLASLVNGTLDQVQHSSDQFSETKNSLLSNSKKLENTTEILDAQFLLSEIVHQAKQLSTETHNLNAQLEQAQKDIAELKYELENTRKIASTDGLTGLLNRRAFDMEINNLLSEQSANPHSLLILDLDHFKKVNDTFGHLVGDQVIRFTANLIKEKKAPHHLAARYGGEELAIIMPETPINKATDIAETIRTSLEKSRLKQKNSNQNIGQITVSIGATGVQPGDSAETVIARADKALYQAKECGRNRVISL